MIRHYIEPVGWLLVCLLFVVALAYVMAPVGLDRRHAVRQPSFDVQVMRQNSTQMSRLEGWIRSNRQLRSPFARRSENTKGRNRSV